MYSKYKYFKKILKNLITDYKLRAGADPKRLRFATLVGGKYQLYSSETKRVWYVSVSIGVCGMSV